MFLSGSWLFCVSFDCNVCVAHRSLSISLGVIDWLCSVIIALPGRLLYYFPHSQILFGEFIKTG